MNNFKVNNPRKNLNFEISFTNAYRNAIKNTTHPAELELACMRAQYPAIFHPIQDEDLIAGRIQMGLVGWGIQHQTGGFGFYINEQEVVKELEKGNGDAQYREDLHDILTFWKGRNTTTVVLNNTPESLKPWIFTDQWRHLPLPICPILRMAGAYLNFHKLVKIGLPGLEKEIKQFMENAEDRVLFESMLGALQLVKDCALFYAEQAQEQAVTASASRKSELNSISSALLAIRERAPQTMLEGLQLVWLYGIMTPAIEYGRLDEYIGDLYVHDVDNGIITEDQAIRYVESFFRLIDHLDCETDGRVIIGGYGRENTENADRFCPVAIEACRNVKEVLPQFTLRFNKDTPENVWRDSLRCIEEGRTYPLLYNDDVLVPGVMKAFDVSRELAETYVPLGCGEIEFDHHSIGSPNGSINTLKILELVMRGGYEPMTDWYIGPRNPKLSECKTYEEFLSYYKAALVEYIEKQAEFQVYEYDITGKTHPFMMVTMLYDGTLEKGKSIFNGGCAYLAGTLEFYGNVNAANSLVAIKKTIFEDKTIDAYELEDALTNNFAGSERIRKLLLDAPKYGNDDDYADSIFTNLHNFVSDTTKKQASRVGLKSYLSVTINNAQNTTLGRWVGATPDGRKAGTPMANANNPHPGTDRRGLTPMINSILKPRHDNHAGMVSNLRFTRENFTSARNKMHSLIENYFERGGAHAMITVIGKDDLKNALERPEEYKDLIIRVGGFSARFVDLNKDVQQEIFDRVTY